MKTRLMLGALAVLLVAGCGGSAPPATTSPAPTASPSGPPDPTTGPTASPLPTFGGDAIAHPTGGQDLILQVENTGGFVPPDFIVTQLPQFSLYGDGTVIIVPTEERGGVLPPGAFPRLLKTTMSEEQVQALLRFALGQGRLLGAREHYPQNTCADCSSTIFRINAGGIDKTVTVDALSIEETSDPIDRRGFASLRDTLAGFEQRALAGELGEVSVYDPDAYLVALFEAQPGQGEAVAWPWDDADLADFTAEGDATWRRDAILSREQVARLTSVPSGGHSGLFIEDESGDLWSVALRPLLPHEIEDGSHS